MHAAKHSLADTFASPGLVSLSARRNGRGLEGPEARVKRGRGDLRPWRMGQDRLGVHRCAVRRCVEMSGVSCIVWSCSVPPGSLLARLWETPQGQEIQLQSLELLLPRAHSLTHHLASSIVHPFKTTCDPIPPPPFPSCHSTIYLSTNLETSHSETIPHPINPTLRLSPIAHCPAIPSSLSKPPRLVIYRSPIHPSLLQPATARRLNPLLPTL